VLLISLISIDRVQLVKAKPAVAMPLVVQEVSAFIGHDPALFVCSLPGNQTIHRRNLINKNKKNTENKNEQNK
jgi:hypothetical protein